MKLLEAAGPRDTDISPKILNKWMNEGKEKAKFTSVVGRGSWMGIFKYLYKTTVRIKCLMSSVAKRVQLY